MREGLTDQAMVGQASVPAHLRRQGRLRHQACKLSVASEA